MQGWGVDLARLDNHYRSNAWVEQIAEASFTGYAANPNHRSAIIAVGTSNGNFPWLCNNATGEVADDWVAAGRVWGQFILDLYEANANIRGRVYIRSGSDIESWNDTEIFGDWTACGAGTLAWLDGYRQIAGSLWNINFGSNAYNERPDQWTQEQLYQVSYGRDNASVSPQIYCPRQAGPWVDLVQNYPNVVFISVTSENAFSDICDGNPTYTWLQSWNVLNDALDAAGLEDRVVSRVTSFCYPTEACDP